MNWAFIADQIGLATARSFRVESAQPLSGGDINAAFRLQGGGQSYFVKLNHDRCLPMFEAELAGLQALAACRVIRIPTPITCGRADGQAFLVLEYIDFGRSNPASERLLGQQLAALHQLPQACFGWHQDNTIGSTPQPNLKSADWLKFWREQRLGFQLQLAASKGYGGQLQVLGERLCADLALFFQVYQPKPALLHGDLWAGNAAVDKQGAPVIYDSACYFGDREADMAMTELFGGFSADFYAAYQSAYPLDIGYKTRKNLYNLYHILNHLNLFGRGYLGQAETMMARLLAEL
jgi:fructosamine-3-kinase